MLKRHHACVLQHVVTSYKDRFLHKALDRVEHCRHEIFDVFGDGNCLFYCLLLMLKLDNNNILSNSPTVTTKFLVRKLRKQLVDYFIERYEDRNDKASMTLRLEILPPDDDEIRNALKQFYNHTDDSLAELTFARAEGMDDVEEFKRKTYQEGVKYVRGTPEDNYNIFLKNLECHFCL